ncbi:hypothetical protein F5884DRAFT_671557 [Xylogone sp. PMI_703]|nr:hypothetical protein F5884DRAFT_671557 [Xylogone sp. PMI_703]
MVDNQPTPKTPKIDPSEIAVNSKNIPSALLKPLNFTALVHPREGRSDEWFQIAFTRSQQRTLRWAKVLFGFCDISAETDSVGKWSAKAGRSFLKEVDKIAVADPNGGVLDMLLDSKQRVSLVAALINNIFQDAVFDEYLFGADKEEKDLLHAMDRAFVADGGFLRTSLRSQIVRAILHTSTVTKNFESEVCSLTKRIYVMFEPLINYIFSITPLKCKEIPRIEDGWQALHNLVANTAFLSICIRLSKDAFHFVHATPDDRYDSERYSILDEEVLQKSKEVALAARQTKMSTISDRRQKAAPTQLYHLVKVSVFPEIECYKHGSGMGDTQGFRIYRIKKGTVQVYYGPKKDDHSNFIPPRS